MSVLVCTGLLEVLCAAERTPFAPWLCLLMLRMCTGTEDFAGDV